MSGIKRAARGGDEEVECRKMKEGTLPQRPEEKGGGERRQDRRLPRQME